MEKVSDAQKRVLKWIGKGWIARRSHGSAIEVNGERICNVDTMIALRGRGLAFEQNDGTWVATESGKTIARQLEL